MCHWPCLGGPESRPERYEANGIHSFADILRGVEEVIPDLPSPTLKGHLPTIRIPRAMYSKGVEKLKFSLIGRLDLSKIKRDRLVDLTKTTWKVNSQIVPLGKGFILFRFDREEDQQAVWKKGPYEFDKQVLWLQLWTPSFDPKSQKQSHAKVWVRFPGLKIHLWEKEILLSIAKVVGKPISVDKFTLEKRYGHFASVLVEVDLSKLLPAKVRIEIEGGEEFVQAIEFWKLPKFCPECKVVGHGGDECRRRLTVLGKPNNTTGNAEVVTTSTILGVGGSDAQNQNTPARVVENNDSIESTTPFFNGVGNYNLVGGFCLPKDINNGALTHERHNRVALCGNTTTAESGGKLKGDDTMRDGRADGGAEPAQEMNASAEAMKESAVINGVNGAANKERDGNNEVGDASDEAVNEGNYEDVIASGEQPAINGAEGVDNIDRAGSNDGGNAPTDGKAINGDDNVTGSGKGAVTKDADDDCNVEEDGELHPPDTGADDKAPCTNGDTGAKVVIGACVNRDVQGLHGPGVNVDVAKEASHSYAADDACASPKVRNDVGFADKSWSTGNTFNNIGVGSCNIRWENDTNVVPLLDVIVKNDSGIPCTTRGRSWKLNPKQFRGKKKKTQSSRLDKELREIILSNRWEDLADIEDSDDSFDYSDDQVEPIVETIKKPMRSNVLTRHQARQLHS